VHLWRGHAVARHSVDVALSAALIQPIARGRYLACASVGESTADGLETRMGVINARRYLPSPS
jgi:hypothetical protein